MSSVARRSACAADCAGCGRSSAEFRRGMRSLVDRVSAGYEPAGADARIGGLFGDENGSLGMALEAVDGWIVWNDGGEKAVLVYRPDVFDSDAFPAPCLPTIYLSKGRRRRQPGRRTRSTDPWFVTLSLEPEVSRDGDRYETREEAEAGIRDLAERFAAGEVDYRSLYQVPREAYLEKLDELTGRGD